MGRFPHEQEMEGQHREVYQYDHKRDRTGSIRITKKKDVSVGPNVPESVPGTTYMASTRCQLTGINIPT